jgi:hypothetical protein
MPITILFLSIWVLIEEFKIYTIFSKLKEDPTLLIPIGTCLSSAFSVLFGLTKILKTVEFNSISYTFLRIGDLIFSILIFILLMSGIYMMLDNPEIRTSEFYLISFSIIVLLSLFSMLILFDNLKYHKKQKAILKKDNIHEIGA